MEGSGTDMIRFDRSTLKPGMILQRWVPGRFSKIICDALSTPNLRCEYSHDAIIVRTPEGDWIGDAVSPRCKLSTFEEWERGINEQGWKVRALWPTGASNVDGLWASHWWRTYVLGKPYDWFAFPRLLLRCALLRVNERAALYLADTPIARWLERSIGAEWAWFCTEGCRDAWHEGDTAKPWGEKTHPTPMTTQKRHASGALELVDGALISDG